MRHAEEFQKDTGHSVDTGHTGDTGAQRGAVVKPGQWWSQVCRVKPGILNLLCIFVSSKNVDLVWDPATEDNVALHTTDN